MRPIILTALLLAHAPALSCQRPQADAGVERMVEHPKAEQAQTKRDRPLESGPFEIAPENREDYRKLLFVDQTLEEATRFSHAGTPAKNLDLARRDLRDGKPAEARKKLRQMLPDPAVEVRYKLLAWNALRALGERPPAEEGREVRGVVLEVWVDEPTEFKGGWIDILAVYSDGRARYLNGHSWRGVIWEAPDDPRIGPLAAAVVRAAAPLVNESRPVERHLPPKEGVVRVTVLTYNGLYVVERDAGVVERQRTILSGVFDAGTVLFLALKEEHEKAQEEHNKTRPERD